MQKLIEMLLEVGQKRPPATDEDFLEVEQRLGFVLPGELKELYRRVSDGVTFEDGTSLYPLEQITTDYHKLRAEHPDWPERLLPLTYDGCDIYIYLDARTPHAVYALGWDTTATFGDFAPPATFADFLYKIGDDLETYCVFRLNDQLEDLFENPPAVFRGVSRESWVEKGSP